MDAFCFAHATLECFARTKLERFSHAVDITWFARTKRIKKARVHSIVLPLHPTI